MNIVYLLSHYQYDDDKINDHFWRMSLEKTFIFPGKICRALADVNFTLVVPVNGNNKNSNS